MADELLEKIINTLNVFSVTLNAGSKRQNLNDLEKKKTDIFTSSLHNILNESLLNNSPMTINKIGRNIFNQLKPEYEDTINLNHRLDYCLYFLSYIVHENSIRENNPLTQYELLLEIRDPVTLRSLAHPDTVLCDIITYEKRELNDQFNTLKEEHEKTNKYIEQVKILQGKLNFLKLGSAFNTFIKSKEIEKTRIYRGLIALGFVIMCIPLTTLYINS